MHVAPVVDLRHLFYSVVSFPTCAMPLSRTSFGVYHTAAPYVIAGRTKAVHTCLALFNVAPHVDAATLVKADDCELVYACTFLTCGPIYVYHLSTALARLTPL